MASGPILTAMTVPWSVVVPVKATIRGKSRLDLPPDLRRRVALAMALDTVVAAAEVAAVTVVVEDGNDGDEFAALPGVLVHRTAVTGLNESILDGIAHVATGSPPGSGVAVLPGDLPGLRPDELRAALEACAQQRFSVIADRQGTGTTLLAALSIAELLPRYGPDSFRLHRLAGAVALDRPVTSGLRRDVDFVADLEMPSFEAGLSWVGVRTRIALGVLAAQSG